MTRGRLPREKLRRRPGEVRDAIVTILSRKPRGASVSEIEDGVSELIGAAPSSSIRSYLRLNSDSLFRRADRGIYTLRETSNEEYRPKVGGRAPFREFTFGRTRLVEADCFEWLKEQPPHSIHAVVTDPPYGL